MLYKTFNSKIILKIDGLFLMIMGTLAVFADLLGYYTGKGPFGVVYFKNNIMIGGLEAHCLAVVLGCILFMRRKACDAIFFNKAGVAIHAILMICNVNWFNVFIETKTIPMGYISTAAHIAFIILNAANIYKRGRTSP